MALIIESTVDTKRAGLSAVLKLFFDIQVYIFYGSATFIQVWILICSLAFLV